MTVSVTVRAVLVVTFFSPSSSQPRPMKNAPKITATTPNAARVHMMIFLLLGCMAPSPNPVSLQLNIK
ncbi:MAG: hypothetical protein C4534_02735 [Gaiellales bacterium]|nr:MAG: hypothetical protein C4534_02735 [Gaiellales bacterium]